MSKYNYSRILRLSVGDGPTLATVGHANDKGFYFEIINGCTVCGYDCLADAMNQAWIWIERHKTT